MKEMKRENKFYVAADKTSNFYKVAPEKYKEMINKEIAIEYKKANDEDLDKLNKEDKAIAEKLDIDDRLFDFRKREPFITVKDHEEN